jgi:Glycosyl transferase family group 2
MGSERTRSWQLLLFYICLFSTVISFSDAISWNFSDLHLDLPGLADERVRLTVIFKASGWSLMIGLSIVGLRMLSYYRSFVFHSDRYRRLADVTTAQLHARPVPYVKIQITTRGSAGSTEVILRGIESVVSLASEDPGFYRRFLSVEVITESAEQSTVLREKFRDAPVPLYTVVLPADYEPPNGTALKARALHYMVELRRRGWNSTSGRTFIVHYDEESVLEPAELRKLIAMLAGTDKRILEGPIYYPLEYLDAAGLCRSMEATRPLGCYECRHVMENGIPLHLHGSNLVVEEDFENQLGWDIGLLDGQPFIAEDYVFGLHAFLQGGPQVFGWHGVAMLEQPPFSVKSARKQRHRWIMGVLQGLTMLQRLDEFTSLRWSLRQRMIWGTRFRIACFALGAPVGILSFLLMPFFLMRTGRTLLVGAVASLPTPLMLWLALVGLMWLGTVLIGAWYNVAYLDVSRSRKWTEIAQAILLAPIAGLAESTAGLSAVAEWAMGERKVNWQPTPKTKAADAAIEWGVSA